MTSENKNNEVRVLSKVNHPNVISMYKAQFYQNRLFIIMELWVHSLATEFENALKNNKFFKESSVRKYMKELLLGVQHLHEIGYLHRDLKPENILSRFLMVIV
jgi:serine/threonine protein kinase